MGRGVVKVVSRGRLMKLHDSYFPITKILDKIHSCNLVWGSELAFPYFAKNPVKITYFYEFLAKK